MQPTMIPSAFTPQRQEYAMNLLIAHPLLNTIFAILSVTAFHFDQLTNKDIIYIRYFSLWFPYVIIGILHLDNIINDIKFLKEYSMSISKTHAIYSIIEWIIGFGIFYVKFTKYVFDILLFLNIVYKPFL